MKQLINHLSICFFVACAIASEAQGGWQHIYPASTASPQSDGIEAVRQTADGGYILAGVGGNNQQCRVVKTDDQGIVQWANNYPLGNTSWATNIEIAPSGGYFVSGRLFNTTAWADRAFLQKLDIYGNQEWIKEFPEAEQAYKGGLTADGGYVMVGYYDANSGMRDTIVIIKTDANGDTDWIKKYPNQGTSIERLPHSIIQTSNGEYVMEGYKDVGFGGISFLWRLDAAGDSLWQHTYGNLSNHPEYIGKVVENPDGSLVLCGNDALGNGANDIYLVKTDAAGTMLWQQRYGNNVDFGTDLDRCADGGYILTGFTNNIIPKVILIKTDATGNEQWQKIYNGDGNASYNYKPYSVRQTSDGGYVVGAARIVSVYDRENMYLIKTDAQGEIYSNILQGYVYHDADANCFVGAGEHRLSGWLLTATKNGQTFYASTDTNGFYSMRVDTGDYQLTLQAPPNHPYWQQSACVNDTLQLSIPNQQTTLENSFAQTALVDCQLLTVDMSAPLLRRCFDNLYHFQYCNNGTLSASDAYIEVEFDSFLVVNTASFVLPFTALGGNSYRIELGTVGVGQCGNFSVQVYVSCDAVLGQTHCSQAHIYPDTACMVLWEGPSIEIEADCMGDSVIFSLTNMGADMPASLAYVVYEDNVLLRPGSFALNSGESLEVTVATNGGATYRIEAQQAAGFPAILGDSLVALAIEGCGGSINTGFVTQFANFDGAAFYDIDCQENRGAYDPNDKRGFPAGYGAAHYIYANTDLDYHIRFQNTGTDTAFNIVIRDTLSQYLDPATLHTGSSSHPYTWKLYGQGGVQAIEFTFSNIELPDSNVNEPASHGFVMFSIAQKPNNVVGTLIENTAAIYFDFNEPIFTNTAFHEIGEDFVEVFVSSDKPLADVGNLQIRLAPNPFSELTNIEVLGASAAWYRFVLYDAFGRELQHLQSNEAAFQLQRNNLAAGVYFYRLESASGAVGTGKLIVR